MNSDNIKTIDNPDDEDHMVNNSLHNLTNNLIEDSSLDDLDNTEQMTNNYTCNKYTYYLILIILLIIYIIYNKIP
jgi:hypothetical protein